MREAVGTRDDDATELTEFHKCYARSRERLLLQQRARREAIKNTPVHTQQTRIYNARYRARHTTSACMLEYYHRGKERIAEARKRLRERLSAAERERQSQLRCDRLREAAMDVSAEPRRPRGKPRTIAYRAGAWDI